MSLTESSLSSKVHTRPPSISWESRLSPESLQQLDFLAETCRRADGIRSLSEEPLLRLRAGTGDAWAAWLPDGLGYAHLCLAGEAAWGELLVDPGARGQGRGRSLAEGLVQAATRRGARRLDVWCFGDRPAGARLALRLGFEPARRLLLQARQLGDLPAREPRWQLEPFRESDVADWMRLHRSGSATLSEPSFRLRLAEPWFEPELLRIARDGGRALGYIWLKPEGELYMLAVAPEARGEGVGRSMVAWGLGELARRGLEEARVFVDESAEAARRLYAGLGFATRSVDCCYRRALA